jgi:hypothetical protein
MAIIWDAVITTAEPTERPITSFSRSTVSTSSNPFGKQAESGIRRCAISPGTRANLAPSASLNTKAPGNGEAPLR